MVEVKVNQIMKVVAKKLFSIETVPKEEQRKMVVRACKAAAKYHTSEVRKVLEELKKKATSMGESMTKTGDEVDKTTGLIKDLAASAQDASTKFILPRLNVLEVDRFADAIETLSGRLNGLSISIPGLADLEKISDFKLPRLYQSEVGRFITSIKMMAEGLKGIALPDLSKMFPSGIKELRTELEAVAELLIGIAGLEFGKLDFSKLGKAGFATETTQKEILDTIKAARGVRWA